MGLGNASELKGSGADGVCDNIAAGNDPKGACATDPPDSCGKTGVCDGKPYSGTFSGTASGGSASGGWTAANEDGSYEGSWKAGG